MRLRSSKVRILGVMSLGILLTLWFTPLHAREADTGVGPAEVTNAERAAEYLKQFAPLFLRTDGADGALEVRKASVAEIADFLYQIFLLDDVWARTDESNDVYVVSFRSVSSTFVAPRAPRGLDATLSGDAFLTIVDPQSRVSTRAVVPWTQVESFFGDRQVLLQKDLRVAGIHD